jgi:hypothetical protein
MSVHSCPIQRSSPKYDWVDERDIADLAAYDKTVPIMVQASNGEINDPVRFEQSLQALGRRPPHRVVAIPVI